MMEKNLIKKILYKDKPTATIIHVAKMGLLYACQIVGEKVNEQGRQLYDNIYFNVPLSELGDTAFLKDMPSQLLIRYIIDEPTY